MKTVSRISHLHLHLGLYLAIGAVMLTALHTSADMVYALYGVQPSYAEGGSHVLREAKEFETHTGHTLISAARRTYVGGL